MEADLQSFASVSVLTTCILSLTNMIHHLMVGTWTPPGAIYTFEFNDESLSLKLVKKTIIAEDEPISWMTFDVCYYALINGRRNRH
jgi:hypothetical protein